MSKPNAVRKADVQSKLAYAKHRHQELMRTLIDAKKSSSDPAFIAHLCADVISSARECLDYLGQDIIEEYIIAGTENAKIKKAHSDGTLRAYFPYFTGQLTKSDSIFLELKEIQPALYNDLLDFTKRISTKAKIPNTLFNYQMLADVRDMVNEKKHDKLLAIVSEADAEVLVQNSDFTMLLPVKSQKGWCSLLVEPGKKVTHVNEYRFAFNDQEVGRFSMFATSATERVVLAFYNDHFA